MICNAGIMALPKLEQAHGFAGTQRTTNAVHPTAAPASGEYFADVNIAKPRSDVDDAAMAKQLRDVSEKIVAEL